MSEDEKLISRKRIRNELNNFININGIVFYKVYIKKNYLNTVTKARLKLQNSFILIQIWKIAKMKLNLLDCIKFLWIMYQQILDF